MGIESGNVPTVKELKDICRKNWCIPKSPYNEVYPGIIIGDGSTALSVRLLKDEGVTHVVNAASPCCFCQEKKLCGTCVLTSASYYSHTSKIVYKGIQAVDDKWCPLWRHFDDTAQFIEDALASNGKVFVHCGEGISRSATLVIAYLMLKKNIPVLDAVKLVRSKREIYPNDGFFQQICDLELRRRAKQRVQG